MSKIGKNIIAIPEKTTVIVNGSSVAVKGPLGELTREYNPLVTISVEGNTVKVAPSRATKLAHSLWGTWASHIQNMVDGVNAKYEKKLEIQGVGYKADLNGKELKLALGFSHPVIVGIPPGLDVSVEKNIITVSGIDKELVGQFSANVRSLKKPEPYKGKGIRYVGEYVRQKQGKKAV